jgi:hypothetical protein
MLWKDSRKIMPHMTNKKDNKNYLKNKNNYKEEEYLNYKDNQKDGS